MKPAMMEEMKKEKMNPMKEAINKKRMKLVIAFGGEGEDEDDDFEDMMEDKMEKLAGLSEEEKETEENKSVAPDYDTSVKEKKMAMMNEGMDVSEMDEDMMEEMFGGGKLGRRAMEMMKKKKA